MTKTETIFGMKLSNRVQAIIILALTFLACMPMLRNGFTYFSDDNYVLNNAIIQNLSWHNIKFIFSAYFDGHYHPLTMLSLGLTWLMSGPDPFQYQLTNLLLHLANTLLVFWLIRKLFRNPEMAFLVALLFGLHTIHVESVARITERKDMLYSLFYLVSAIAYINFLDRKQWKYYHYSLFTITLSLLSKGQAVSFFFTLLLIDYLRDRNLLSRQVILEKVPFLALALFFGYLNLQAQKFTGYFLDYRSMAFYEPVLDSAYVLTNYILKMVLPVNLSALYPYPNQPGEAVPAYMWLYLLTFIAVIFLSIYFYKKNKAVFFGILFYLLNIFLMLRIIPVAENIMPDRYNYVPSIGFFIILYSLFVFIKEKKRKFLRIAQFTLSCYLVILFILTFQRTQIWKSGDTVWNDALKKHPDNTYILQNVANLQISQGKYREGFSTVDKAMAADPQNILALISRLKANTHLKNTVAVEKDLDYIRQLEPVLAEQCANKANALFMYGNMRRDAAMIGENYRKAIEKYPYNAKFYYNLGVFCFAMQDYGTALENFDRGIGMKPYNIDYYLLYRGMTNQQLGETEESKQDFRKALKFNPENIEIKKQLKKLLTS